MNVQELKQKNKFWFLAVLFILILGLISLYAVDRPKVKDRFWQVQSVDTVKHSRDEARLALQDPNYSLTIEKQVARLADIGATHVAIGTPYDEEFAPVLSLWVSSIRQRGLSVWFRGNWAGWEQWFGYPGISRDEHLRKTEVFILSHTDLFADGDIFTACPECENGGPGDPRQTHDLDGHREFLIEEYEITSRAFATIEKSVRSNFNSMNGDVAKFVMDRQTTTALQGVVTVDHYVATPGELIEDIRRIAEISGGKIVLGELGVPLLDIHGAMSPEEQAEWLDEALDALSREENIIGLNYWVSDGGSTALWDTKGEPKPAVEILKKYYRPN